MINITSPSALKKIAAIRECGDTIEVDLNGASPPLEQFKVKILRIPSDEFTCHISHFVHRTGLSGPHRPGFQNYKSANEAFTAAISHGLMNYDLDDIGARWELNSAF